ncbi:hypothetical protein CY34DRAFT_809717 [Suillus luteus UH-Slu-Lm8-n1]|uniref:Uncharacterized protein n=1 Tax=Suillus luteus UH-Slu-Lm8-n1 TaxID=930992 RepID=A0A0D0AUT3_9AGAM|nr:hypothetical protein CY34DRAFT_809717 [Suillus luteus UH-Slu-Lm8-n1]
MFAKGDLACLQAGASGMPSVPVSSSLRFHFRADFVQVNSLKGTWFIATWMTILSQQIFH